MKYLHVRERDGRYLSELREAAVPRPQSEEHTSELQSQSNLVCRLLLEKKKNDETYARPRVRDEVYARLPPHGDIRAPSALSIDSGASTHSTGTTLDCTPPPR